ncbi:MAG: hypothetical protein WDW36_006019 [Sanguina aurantia]
MSFKTMDEELWAKLERNILGEGGDGAEKKTGDKRQFGTTQTVEDDAEVFMVGETQQPGTAAAGSKSKRGVSAYLNPAVALGAWILGDVTTAQFFVILAGTVTGATLSGFLVYLLYFNQFKVTGSYRRKYESSIADMTTTQTLESALGNAQMSASPSSASQTQAPLCMPLTGDCERGAAPRLLDSNASLIKPNNTAGAPAGEMKHRAISLSSGGSSRDLGAGPGPKVDYRKENPYLTIFATHPAIRSPIINYLSEAFMTFFFVLFINLIHNALQRASILDPPGPSMILRLRFPKHTRPSSVTLRPPPPAILCARRGQTFLLASPATAPLWPLFNLGVEPLVVGTILGTVILSLGGATGGALNPARDFGPRVAHTILSLGCSDSNSEWGYAWVPVLGPFTGAAVAAGVFKALSSLQPTV